LLSAEQRSHQPPPPRGECYAEGYPPRGLKCDEVGNGSQRRRTAKGAVLKIGSALRMVVMPMVSGGVVGRAELDQKRSAARGHEAHRDIGTEKQRGQQ
jgi:hypothetical protein